jgi:transposase
MIFPKLGNDVSKRSFDACLLIDNKPKKRKFDNSESGFSALSQWLSGHDVTRVHACMEATGRYGDKLAAYLYDQGHKVSVINPKRIKNHAAALGKLNKTDATDAYVIAHYAQCHDPHDWQPKPDIQLELSDTVGQMALLKKAIVAFENRGQCGLVSASIAATNDTTLVFLRKQLDELQNRAAELLEQDAQLKKNAEILDSVPGMGPVIALALVAKIDFTRFQNGRELACVLGISPRVWQSGETIRRRGKITKAGDDQLRALLRCGAMSDTYTCPLYIQFADRLRQKGLREGQVIAAVARKMILTAHALVRKQQLFDACYIHPLAKAA